MRCVALAILALPVLFLVRTSGAPVMAVDMGTDTFRVAVVMGGRFETAINPVSSQRKTASIVGFPEEQRVFARPAVHLRYKQPQQTVVAPQELLSVTMAEVSAHPERFSPLFHPTKLVADADGLVTYQLPHLEEPVSPEEALAMLYNSARLVAEGFSTVPGVRDAVLTVPPWLTPEQRLATIEAAELGGISVLAVMNEGTSLALQYCLARNACQANGERTVVAFYDMGHSSTKVSIVEYKSVQDTAKNTSVPQLNVLASKWNRALGGRDFDAALVAHMAAHADKTLKCADGSVTKSPRRMATILKEANNVKETLSANTEVYSSIEGLCDDKDFRMHLTRAEAEALWAPLIAAAPLPLIEALEAAEVDVQQLAAVEVVGGGVRVPAVQQKLLVALKRDTLDKHINGDEGVVHGAVLFAAMNSKGLKVKEVRIKDSISDAVTARFTPAIGSQRDSAGEDDEVAEVEVAASTTSVIFRRGMRFGAKKSVGFRTNETSIQVELFGNNGADFLASYNITGFGVLNKHKNQVGRPKVHASFRLTSSGLPELESAEAEVITLIAPSPSASATPSASTPPADADEPAAADESTGGTDPSAREAPAPAEVEAEPPKPKRRTQREHLRVIKTKSGRMSAEQRKKSERVLRALEKRDQDLLAFFESKNNLESYVYKIRELVEYDEDTLKYARAEERQAALAAADEAESWLDSEDAEDAEERRDTQAFTKQLRALTDISGKWADRKEEADLRAEAVVKLLRKLNTTASSLTAISVLKNVTVEEEAGALQAINDLRSWVLARMAEQKNLAPSDEPAFRVKDLSARLAAVEVTTKALLRRPRRLPPSTSQAPSASADPETGEAAADAPKEDLADEEYEDVPAEPSADDEAGARHAEAEAMEEAFDEE